MKSQRGCKDRPAPDELPGYWAQDGWTDDGRPNKVFIRTPWKPMGCGYEQGARAADERCAGCRWRVGNQRAPSLAAQFEAECG